MKNPMQPCYRNTVNTRFNPETFLPVDIDDVNRAFPASVKHLMPPYDQIPDDFWSMNNRTKWNDLQATWFYKGLPPKTKFIPKEGVDKDKALRHLGTIQGSFEPSHEHKAAAVAYLMSLWFEDIKLPKDKKKKKKGKR